MTTLETNLHKGSLHRRFSITIPTKKFFQNQVTEYTLPTSHNISLYYGMEIQGCL